MKDLLHDCEDLSVGDHRVILASNVEVTLVELSEPSFGCGWLVSPVYFANVEPLDLFDVCVHGHKPGEGDGQVISKGALFSTLVLEVIDKLGVLTVLSHQYLLQLEDRSINLNSSMPLEDRYDNVHHPSADGHLFRVEVSGSLWTFQLKFSLVLHLFGISINEKNRLKNL